MKPDSIAVVGTTLWGATLSIMLARQGHKVSLIARTLDEAELLSSERSFENRLPGYRFPDLLEITSDWTEGLSNASIIVFAVPSNSMRDNARRAFSSIKNDPIVISASKGLEKGTSKRMSVILHEELGIGQELICVLSGPNLAREIVQGLPASSVVASSSEEASLIAQSVLNSNVFRVYTNTDIVGTEIAGALKNIIAIGAGICDGMSLGDNAKAGFINRGLAEMTRLGVACGAQPSTFAGNAGLGDLLATCYSTQSRNYRVGVALANGQSPEDAIRSLGGEIAEGVWTSFSAAELAENLNIEIPIIEMTNRIIKGTVSPSSALNEFMNRSIKQEN